MDLNKESARLAQLKMSEKRALEDGIYNKPKENEVMQGCGMMRPIGGAKRGRGRPRKSAAAPKKESKEGKSSKAHKAEELGEAYGKAIEAEDDDVKELVGSGFFSDFARGFKKGFKSVVSPAVKIAGLIPTPQAQIASAVGSTLGLGKAGAGKAGAGRAGAGKAGAGKAGAGKRQASEKMKKRGALVSKLMKKHNMSLGQASKYIKENDLL